MTGQTIDTSTEDKIKEAARQVFTRKGYEATKMRDIAAEADINLSLINYYFRSKERLFRLIMEETTDKLLAGLRLLLNNPELSLIQKVEKIADHYITLLLEHPNLPAFILKEILSNAEGFIASAGPKQVIFESHMVQQMIALGAEGKIAFNPIHIFMNTLGMIVFPFIARPVILKAGAPLINEDGFKNLMLERKKLIPIWVAGMAGL
ncbi:MAG: TetR family transcriptional regulator [Bacteroidota bacterium]